MAYLKALWYYLRNPFDNITKENFKRMLILSRDHHDKLNNQRGGSAEIQALYDEFLPFYTAFTKLYTDTNNNWALYQSNTLVIEALFASLRKKIKTWEAWILTVYEDGSTEYVYLLPNHRSPFQIGAYELRLSALGVFQKALATYPLLSNVLDEVTLFRTKIETARTKQQGFEQLNKRLRQDLERARIDLAIALHRAFAGLVHLYAEDLAIVETFYELHYFRKPAAKANTPVNTVMGNSRRKALEGSFAQTTIFQLRNSGKVELGFFIADNENAATPGNLIRLGKGETEEFTIDELSNGSTPQVLIVVNKSASEGRYQVALIKPDEQ